MPGHRPQRLSERRRWLAGRSLLERNYTRVVAVRDRTAGHYQAIRPFLADCFEGLSRCFNPILIVDIEKLRRSAAAEFYFLTPPNCT
jgi:hypothetical protein